MTLVAKRKVTQGWAEAVAARAEAGNGAAVVAAYEALLAAGRGEAEAAYRALEAHGLLWSADEPGPTEARPDGEVPAA